ncbi:MAG: hypothetical protein JWN84_747 [Nocardioides sp.]|nr:hypothetical protein [Nocardioides sp.]
MKTLLLLPVLLLAALVALLTGPASAGPSAPPAERPVIVEVEGDKANGFGIHHADGSAIFPPTDSEAAAECSEYDTRLARVRCRVEVRTWYRDLGDLQRSLAWVRAHE